MKILKVLSLSILLGSFLLVGCTPNDSSSQQSSSSDTPTSDTSGGDTPSSGNENPSDLPWIG